MTAPGNRDRAGPDCSTLSHDLERSRADGLVTVAACGLVEELFAASSASCPRKPVSQPVHGGLHEVPRPCHAGGSCSTALAHPLGARRRNCSRGKEI